MLNSLKMSALLALCVLLAGCESDRTDSPDNARRPEESLMLQEAETVRWVPVSAQVATVDEAQVLARIPGILSSISVKEGDYVRRGDVIGRIIDNSLGYQSGAYGAQAAAAQAQAAQAEAELARIRYLYDNGVYAKARLEQAEAAAKAARAQVNTAIEQGNAVRAVAGQGVVVAPASGRVLAADIPAGAPVAPGMAIVTITSGAVVLRLDVPESLAASIHPGSQVIAGEGEGELRGSVSRVYPSVRSGQVRVDVSMPALDAALIGRRLPARVEAGRRRALLIPRGYVTTRYGVDYVTLRAKDGANSNVPVQVAPSREEGNLEVLSGLSAGDVVLAGASK